MTIIKKYSSKWMNRHVNDYYVKQAQKDGYRSRAVYKIIELQEKYKFIKSNSLVLDLGSAPGSWSQYVANLLGDNGKLVSCDKLMMDEIVGVDFIQGDFEDETISSILLRKGPYDAIISDMAPNMTGMKRVDQLRSIGLTEFLMDIARPMLNLGGCILMKVFQGPGFDKLYSDAKKVFTKVYIKKPKASRKDSIEIYLLAIGYSGKI